MCSAPAVSLRTEKPRAATDGADPRNGTASGGVLFVRGPCRLRGILPSTVEYNSMSKRIKSETHAQSAPPRSSGVQLLTIGASGHGQRVDNFLCRHLRGVPKSHIYRLLRSGQVRVNGGRIRAHYRLQPGDRLRVPPVRVAHREGPAARAPRHLSARVASAVLREDEHFLILDKPAGVAVHGGTGNVWGVIELLRGLRSDLPELSLAHRLDRDTSGCLVLAKHRAALLGFQDALRQGRVTKTYLVLLGGRVTENGWRVEAPLGRVEGAMRVTDAGKRAVTEFRVLRRMPGATLVRARLRTGRMHQIRVHAAHVGHPVLGDDKYGDFAANRLWRKRGLRRLFLHAERLVFGFGGRRYDVRARLPGELESVLDPQREEA